MDKMMRNKKTDKLQEFYFNNEGISVKATTRKEAIKKLDKILKNQK